MKPRRQTEPDLGVVMTDHTGTRWSTLIRTLPMRVRDGAFRASLTPPPDRWLIILDPRTAPVQVAPWIGSLESPMVLVTPQTRAARSIAAHLAPLVIAHPADVADSYRLWHVLHLAPMLEWGSLVYQPPKTERMAPRCWLM